MITARIEFLQNRFTADLSQPPIRLNEKLQNNGVLTPQNMIMLDNSRTLKIHLYPDNYMGERILELVDRKTDSLGAVNRLCHMVNCMDSRDRNRFFKNIDEGKYYTLSEAQHDISKAREHRKRKIEKGAEL